MRSFILIAAIVLTPFIVRQTIGEAQQDKLNRETPDTKLTSLITDEGVVLDCYPNPNAGRFSIYFVPGRQGRFTITISSILGKEVFKESIQESSGGYKRTIDMSGRRKGFYILQIHQDKNVFGRKILIE
ncbi:MAG: T9SS type A sorting domain-containing protein [Cyclobacteriaceae bacterium]|nr:T9SS type A sorting domain-containing protein [Cyclobacteriaceae bacterium]